MELTDHQKKYINDEAKAWIEALLSGEFKQTKEQLYCSQEDAYCCLGVACEISEDVNRDVDDPEKYWYESEYETTQLPYAFRWVIGLASETGSPRSIGNLQTNFDSLVRLNDEEDYTFGDIANHLLKFPEVYFEPINGED
jgi:hypothetical protein